MGILTGVMRFLFYGFCAVGVLILYLWIADKISETHPTLGRTLSSLALAGFYAVLLAVISVWFVGSRTAVYLVPIFYPFALFVAWRDLKPDSKDQPSVRSESESRRHPQP
jgi:hypothetical protein